jgi:predicted ATPase/DNA-binding CsgD family transcriptional regulator
MPESEGPEHPARAGGAPPPGAGGRALPAPLTSFVGRERELAAVRDRLGDPGVRLLTLTGPSGVGKTRLALAAARDLDGGGRFADGVWFAGLAPLADAALVPQVIATTLGIREEAGRPLLEAVQESLRARRLLLVLDNCEHLVDACARGAEALLHACPLLTILATSREALNIAGETVWPVPALSVPPGTAPCSPDELLQYDAIRLFVERAGATVPAFALTDATAAAAAEICARLDGLPLAIELAAARVRLLAPEQIAARLGDRFRLLTGGARTALPRHQTLRALVDWSYELLPEAERTLFCRLGVFAGDWGLEAAEAVGGGDGIEPGTVVDLLGHLVDKSLVVVQPPAPGAGGAGGTGGEVRYRLLETLRQYAVERLAADGAIAAAARRHARYFLALAERADARFLTGDEAGALSRIEPEHENVRAALRHFLASSEAECAARLAGALGLFWFFRGHFDEGRAALREVLARAAPVGPAEPSRVASGAYAKALHADGRLAHGQGDYATAEQRLHAALARWRQLGDRVQIAHALFLLGLVELFRGQRAAARPFFLESLAIAEAAGDRWVAALDWLWLAQVAFDAGDAAVARAWAERALAGVEAAGSRRNTAMALRLLGDVEARQGDAGRARRHFEASLARAREVGRWLAAWTAVNLADLLTEQHDPAGARALLGEALRTYRDAGGRQGTARSLEGCARLAATAGAAAQAVRLAGAAAALRAAAGAPVPPPERLTLDRHLAAARAALGARAAGAAWAAGQALPPAQATAEALAWLEAPEPGPGGPGGPREPAPGRVGPLTPREREVAALVARGLTNRAIARELVITEATAERHLGNVYAKLGLGSRAQLAVWALEHGLGPQRPG